MNFLRRALPYLIAVVVAFIIAGIFIALMGYDPFKAYATIFGTSFKTPYGFVQTILKWIPLTLQALAFTIPFATGKYNIGGEGQMIAGAIGATAVGILFTDLPIYFLLPLEILAGIIAGALWGLVPAYLLYQFKINEILTTVLFNFIAFNLIDYVATGPWSDPTAGHPTTIAVGEGGFLPNLLTSQPLNAGVLIAIAVAVGVYVYTNRTVSGYELVATGANPKPRALTGSMFAINSCLPWCWVLRWPAFGCDRSGRHPSPLDRRPAIQFPSPGLDHRPDRCREQHGGSFCGLLYCDPRGRRARHAAHHANTG